MARPQTPSHCNFDYDDYEFTPKIVKQEPDEEIPEVAAEVEIGQDSDESSDSDDSIPQNFTDILLEHILPYAQYLNKTSTKKEYYDKILKEMQPQCPRIRGPQLRKIVQKHWSRLRLAAKKKFMEKRLLTVRDRRILNAIGSSVDSPKQSSKSNPDQPSSSTSSAPKTPEFVLHDVICQAVKPFVRQMKTRRDSTTARLWNSITDELVTKYPKLKAEPNLRRIIQNSFWQIRASAIKKQQRREKLDPNEQIAILAEGNEDEEASASEEEELDVGSQEEFEMAVCKAVIGHPLLLSAQKQRSDPRLPGMWLEVTETVHAELPNARAQSMQEIRRTWRNHRRRALEREGTNRMDKIDTFVLAALKKLDAAKPLKSPKSKDVERPKTEEEHQIIPSSPARDDDSSPSSSKRPIRACRMDSLSPTKVEEERTQKRLKMGLRVAGVRPETNEIPELPTISRKRRLSSAIELARSSNAETESRPTTANSRETSSIPPQDNRLLSLSDWFKVVDFSKRMNLKYRVDGNQIIFTDREAPDNEFRLPLDRVGFDI